MSAPLLEMRNIAKTFGAVRALRNGQLQLWPGEVHALMGENGAGKSTLIKVLAGAHQADPGGEIVLEGRPVQIRSPIEAAALGISVIYQELALAPNLTVAENMYLGRERAMGGRFSRRAIEAAARPILDSLGVTFSPHTPVSRLSLGERQIVEIARALSTGARIVVMDEPTTSLTLPECERLFAVIRDLKARGVAIVYISHRMDEVYALSDRVTVLRDASYVGTLERDAISAGKLVQMMVGRDLSSFYTKEHQRASDEVILRVRDIADGVLVRNCSFDLRKGEVLGIAGLIGAGRTELARLIFGADPRASGTIEVAGKQVTIRNPSDAIRAGVAYLTEDRKALGLLLDMTIGQNINLDAMGRDAFAFGWLNFGRGRARSEAAIRDLRIRASGEQVFAGALSGGNQQKVLLARLIEMHPKVLILDEPTRGVDVGAKSEIYRLIDEMAAKGFGIVVISSELPEIMGICDRTLVMCEGRITGSLDRADFQQDRIMALATDTTHRLAAE